ncbi:UNVERIFIED_CONTAM: hypothetical protein HDU68_002747 [Siphonaria sp. JEL0065]|nr:hypothetical protein HDU68_002747 [Siphonaria sp. JEL0065]
MLGGATEDFGLSEYEQQREARIEEQNRMLRELGLLVAKPMMRNETKQNVTKQNKAKRKRKTETETETAAVEQRQTRFSLRSRRVKIDEIQLDLKTKVDVAVPVASLQLDPRDTRVAGDIEFAFEDGHEFETLKSVLLEGREASGEPPSVETAKVSEYRNLTSPIQGSIKVTREMIYSIALHPSVDKILAFVGDKLGNLGLWDISDTMERGRALRARALNGQEVEELEPRACDFKPFNKPISRILFKHDDLCKVYLSCFDGSIRLMDIETQKFQEVFLHPDQDMISHFDLGLNANLLWISDGSGAATHLDIRAPRPGATNPPKFYQLSEKKINTIHINPVNQNHIVIGGLDRTVKIFDVRNMKPISSNNSNDTEVLELVEPLITLEHRLSVNAAYWDPKGVDIVSTSFDDTLGLWKNVMTEKEDGLIKIHHNNQTGRWVQKFKGVWRGQDACHYSTAASHAFDPSAIVIGNMQRTVDIYSGVTGTQNASLRESSLTAIPAVNVFHPSLNLIVSGNASGRMNVWC